MDKITSFDRELDQYGQRISTLKEDQLKKELDKVNSKLVVPFLVCKDGRYFIDLVDISDNKKAKERFCLRKEMNIASKWINYVIYHTYKSNAKTNIDFGKAWGLINAVFVSTTTLPDYDNRHLPKNSQKFMDTLTCEGLRAYKKFLVTLANEILFKNSKTAKKIGKDSKTKDATKFIRFNEFINGLKNTKAMEIRYNFKYESGRRSAYFSHYFLPSNWETFYKNIMKQSKIQESMDVKQKNAVKESEM